MKHLLKTSLVLLVLRKPTSSAYSSSAAPKTYQASLQARAHSRQMLLKFRLKKSCVYGFECKYTRFNASSGDGTGEPMPKIQQTDLHTPTAASCRRRAFLIS
ncbi:hypothetical protein BKA62DRAFT_208418 [Auriculariales sp. MPI-PUGE-AT-0066]|nr:hypothetical protein BKA62DRAFT_208418 [Auriculariales sp. MPI-PUGE-AT-0066]